MAPPEPARAGEEPAGTGPDPARALAEAPAYALPDTRVEWLDSAEVGIRYKLYVSLPKRYASRSERFPVVYLLDADYSFALAHQIEQQLSDYAGFPELILVGIGYDHPVGEGWERSRRKHRTRDYTPVASNVKEPSGGGERFLGFLERELLPHVDRTYRTLPGDRTLVGHSYGGLFATWAILERPQLFQRAVLVSPSYWYAGHWIFDYENLRAKELQGLPVAVCILVGNREVRDTYDMVADAQRMVRVLSSRRHRGLLLRGIQAPGEEHDSVFPGALSTGLRVVFDRFEPAPPTSSPGGRKGERARPGDERRERDPQE